MYVETAIIGGGYGGINLACLLEKEDQDYLILEKETLLHPWKTARWDGFQMNTPHGMNRLYGQEDNMDDASCGKDFEKEVELWQKHVDKQNLNFKEHCRVDNVTTLDGSDSVVNHEEARFAMDVESSSGDSFMLTAKNVVCCTGEHNIPKIPSLANELPKDIPQIHSKDFVGPEQFAANDSESEQKAVLVVGSGQSGCQIADKLAAAGEKVWLCTGKSNGIFRSYRGSHIYEWMKHLGYTDATKEMGQAVASNGKQVRHSKSPVLGSEESLSYFSLARRGVQILGRLDSVDNDKLVIQENRTDHVQQAVRSYNDFCDLVKGWVERQPAEVQESLPAETPETSLPEPQWQPIPELLESNGPTEMSLKDCRGVIFCTGYKSGVSTYLNVPEALESDMDNMTGSPDTLVSKQVPGLFYVGFPWSQTAVSAVLLGMEQDQKIIVDKIVNDNSADLPSQ